MKKYLLWRLALACTIAGLSFVPMPGTQAPQTRAASSPVVTMFAGSSFTPYPGPITKAHPHVQTALTILAQQFQKQTGIQIKFINPSIGMTTGNGYPDWNRYIQSVIAANSAPDIVDAPQGLGLAQLGWPLDLTSYFAQPNPYVPGNKHWSDLYSQAMRTLPEGNGGILASDNHFYELPISGNYPFVTIGTFYNKDLWQKAGMTEPPRTWEAWMQNLAKLKAAGISAGMAPNTGENKTGSLWPLWSTLDPPFTEPIAEKADTNHNGVLSDLEQSTAIVNGTISMSDPRMQAPWLQYKRQASYYLPGWNAADIEQAWTTGKVAGRYGGFWELPTEASNTGIKFKWGFFPPVPVTTATSPLATGKFTWLPVGASNRIAKAQYADGVAIVANSVKRDNNQDAVIKWLRFITTPQADEFIVNENASNGVPLVVGTHTSPIYNVLNSEPVPYYQMQVYPYQTYNAETADVQHESVVWLLNQESDSAFFAHVQTIIMKYAKQFIADSKKPK